MTQPKFAPILEADEVREVLRLPVPPPWTPHRPADFSPSPDRAAPAEHGRARPDQGYALALAERFEDRLRLSDGEHPDDVLAAAVAIGLRRAALLRAGARRRGHRARPQPLRLSGRSPRGAGRGAGALPPRRSPRLLAAARHLEAVPEATLRLKPGRRPGRPGWQIRHAGGCSPGCPARQRGCDRQWRRRRST